MAQLPTRAAFALMVVLVIAACASQRVAKSEVATEFLSLGWRAGTINEQWHAAAEADPPKVTNKRIHEYNAFLESFKKRFHQLRVRYDVATPDQLPVILVSVQQLRRELEQWANP